MPKLQPWPRLAWLLLAGLLWASAGLAQEALRVGLLPTLSPRALINQYQPLRDHLERELGRPVVLYTAPDFRTFHRETSAGAYDLVLTAAHLARLAELEFGLLPLATYTNVNRPMLVVAAKRPMRELTELRGQTLAVFDPLALNVLAALKWIETQGLRAGRDYQVLEVPGHNSVGHALTSGKALLGVTAPSGWKALPPQLRDELAIWRELPATLALVWLAHPRLEQEVERLTQALLRFQETAPGQAFFLQSSLQGLRKMSPGELKTLDALARELSRRLREDDR